MKIEREKDKTHDNEDVFGSGLGTLRQVGTTLPDIVV